MSKQMAICYHCAYTHHDHIHFQNDIVPNSLDKLYKITIVATLDLKKSKVELTFAISLLPLISRPLQKNLFVLVLEVEWLCDLYSSASLQER